MVIAESLNRQDTLPNIPLAPLWSARNPVPSICQGKSKTAPVPKHPIGPPKSWIGDPRETICGSRGSLPLSSWPHHNPGEDLIVRTSSFHRVHCTWFRYPFANHPNQIMCLPCNRSTKYLRNTNCSAFKTMTMGWTRIGGNSCGYE